METNCLACSHEQSEDLKKAAEILAGGGLVALPTETVYGLAADARQGEAVRRIYEAKGRPNFNPLIVHVSDLERAKEIGEFDEVSSLIAQNFWPGPLTIVVPLKKDAGISDAVTAGLSTIALRAPDHGLSQELLILSGLALAAPSANSSGKISPTSADHVRGDLGAKVDFILDGGETRRGLESTIVKVERDEDTGQPIIICLRPGPITVEELVRVTDLKVHSPQIGIDETGKSERHESHEGNSTPIAPGALLRHYAPSVPVRLEALDVRAGEGLIGFGAEDLSGLTDIPFFNLSEAGDLEEAAQRLFAGLHWMEKRGVTGIAVRPIPHAGVGVALNDRLKRAAHSA
jgi:L-threonylcarbamoyladenylate synthase